MSVRIAVTYGEPAGIGPDICLQLVQRGGLEGDELVLIGDPQVLAQRARVLGLAPPELPAFDAQQSQALSLLSVPCNAEVRCGELNVANAASVLETLRHAADGVMEGVFHAICTAPVHKGVINASGMPFSGHTEFFAERAQAHPVMMLASGDLRVALATTHLPLSKVPAAITPEGLTQVIHVLHRDLRDKFSIAQPRILVCGLNPHAGEGGHLGDEELRVIEPVVRALKEHGMQLQGPLPADTAFTQRHLAQADAVLAMYHDQGLPVLKHASFGQAVNITLGLPFIRTSVDHGTALDIAGSGRADSGSLLEAIHLARDLARNSP